MSGPASEMYEAGKFDVAHLFFSKFKSALTQEPTRAQVIPAPVDVALDPGHSWADVGATGGGLREYQVTLDIAFRTRAYLEAAGLTVRMTRDDNEPLTTMRHPDPTTMIRLEQEARIADLSETNLARWHEMSLGEQLALYRTKIDVEIVVAQTGLAVALRQGIDRREIVEIDAIAGKCGNDARPAVLAGQPQQGSFQQPFQTFGQKRAAEKLNRVFVFLGPFAQIHLPQVGSKLGLLIAARSDIVMRCDDLAPGLQASLRPALGGGERGLARPELAADRAVHVHPRPGQDHARREGALAAALARDDHAVRRLVAEFGPVNRSIHKVNEAVALEEIEPLTRVYRTTIEDLLLAR